MTDRELLELAAKAAGIGIDWSVFLDNGSHKIYRVVNTRNYWNPLTDDGDALRLAVKSRLEITWWKQGVRVEPAHGRESVTPFGDDPYAATRLAIVRAAAEIGKGTP